MSYVGFQYAEALFSVALEEKELDNVVTAFGAFLDVLDRDVALFLQHPKVRKDEKKAVLKDAVEHPIFRHFLFVLIDNNRIDSMDDIHHEFTSIMNNQNKIMEVTVYSPKPLTKAQLENVKESIGIKHNRTVVLTNSVDPSIIGGMRMEYEGHVLDHTINHHLSNLKNNLQK